MTHEEGTIMAYMMVGVIALMLSGALWQYVRLLVR